MPRKARNEVLVGLFITVALSLLVLLFFLKGTLGGLIQPMALLEVAFPDIRGLKTGDPVFFLGSKVGQVINLQFDQRKWGEYYPLAFPGEKGERILVLVTIQVPRKVRNLMRRDSPVEIDKNLTGNLSVLILEGKGEPLTEDQYLLRGSTGADLGAIAGRVSGLLGTLEPAVEELARLVRRLSGSGELEKTLTDLAQAAREIREGTTPIRENLEESLRQAKEILKENRPDIRAATANLAEGSELARRLLSRVEPAADDLRAALVQLERAGGAAADTLESNRRGLDDIVESVRKAVANAANLTADVRRRPWRLLYRPSNQETESLDLYDAAWAYNLGAAELERSLSDLAAGLAKDPGGTRSPEGLRAAYLRVEESLRRHKEFEDAFWKRLQER